MKYLEKAQSEQFFDCPYGEIFGKFVIPALPIILWYHAIQVSCTSASMQFDWRKQNAIIDFTQIWPN